MPAKKAAKAAKNKPAARKPAARTSGGRTTASKAKSARPRPRVPRDQFMVRTSERSSFKRCRQQWKWGFVDKLKPRIEKPALRFGTLVHAALEQRYPVGVRRGPHPAGVFEKLYEEELKQARDEFGFYDADGEWADALEIGVDMLNGYIDEYGRDEDWEVVASEMTFQVPVFLPCEVCGGTGKVEAYRRPGSKAVARKLARCKRCRGSGQTYAYTYVGTIDGVWRNRMDGGVRLQDYKTTKNDALKEARSKTLDEQATAYWTWGVDALIREGALKPRHIKALDGMLYTFMRKAKRDTRPQNAQGQYLNKDGTVSQKQPPVQFHRELVYRSEAERERARARALAEVEDMKGLIAAVEKDPATMKIYKAPHWINCPMCEFKDICELHEIGQDWEAMAKATMRTWNPYDAHVIKEAEQR